MPLALTTDLTAETGVIASATVGGVTNQIADKFSAGITAADLSDDAGIRKDQIADNCITYPIPVDVLPGTGHDGNLTNTEVYTITSATYQQVGPSIDIVLDSSQRSWLCSIRARCGTLVAGPGLPRVEVRKNGTLIPGATFDFDTSDGLYYDERANPVLNPLDTLENGDVITFHILNTGAGAPTLTHLSFTLTVKTQLVRS